MKKQWEKSQTLNLQSILNLYKASPTITPIPIYKNTNINIPIIHSLRIVSENHFVLVRPVSNFLNGSFFLSQQKKYFYKIICSKESFCQNQKIFRMPVHRISPAWWTAYHTVHSLLRLIQIFCDKFCSTLAISRFQIFLLFAFFSRNFRPRMRILIIQHLVKRW